MVTVAGTLAALLLLESVTCAPPEGAAALRVTVPVDDCAPPLTLVGFSVSEETVTGGGVTVSEAVRSEERRDGEVVGTVEAATACVLTVKLALLAPAGMVTVAGTLAALLLLESATCAPPDGAAALRVTVPVDDCAPPLTLVGLSVSEETVTGGGVTVSEAVRVVPP